MSENCTPKEVIELALPLNGAYVSAARLTVASIANRIGFDVDEIEDLKAAVSEACIYIIKKCPYNDQGESRRSFNIHFVVYGDTMEIKLNSDICVNIGNSQDEIGLVMIRALMDNMIINTQGSNTEISMLKKHKKLSF